MKPREDVLKMCCVSKNTSKMRCELGQQCQDPADVTQNLRRDPPISRAVSRHRSASPYVSKQSASRQRLGSITGEEDSLSLSPLTGTAVSCLVDPMWLRRNEGIISFSVKGLRRAYTSSYIDLYIEIWICSLLSVAMSDSCQQGASWPPCPLCTFHSAMDLAAATAWKSESETCKI